MNKSYDPKCEALARHFAADARQPLSEAKVQDLAIAIQHAVEEWFFDENTHGQGAANA